MHRSWYTAIIISLAILAQPEAGQALSFEGDVWPILSEHCIRCHGTEKQEGKLRLDTPEGIAAGGDFGTVVEIGKPESSTLIELISLPADDPDVMPAKGDRLTESEIATLTAWITEGASFEGWTPALADKANARAKAFWAQNESQPVVLPATFISRSSGQPIEFNRDIRPILSDNCFKCHGQDEAARKADLRLDIEEIAKRKLDGNRVIDEGKPRESRLIQRIFQSDPEELMPPAHSGKKLTDAQKNLLAEWIEQGAEYQAHWSYITPKCPDVKVARNDTWSRNPIDSFILNRLQKEGLTPSPQADPVTLVRRLHYDLTGLPPTPEVVDAFAANPSREAYSALVDGLLASTHYGERMAINWLDQVRYADSNGYHSDEERVVYPYRDYVIESFNANKPFDQFTIEQLAGDLLEDPTTDQLVATAFNRLNQITAEGGAQSKEYRAKYNADRVRALGSVWMGATLGCAECHGHKFDPYGPHDFYRFAAFFADVEEDDVYPGRDVWSPILRLPNPLQENQINEIDTNIAELEAAVQRADWATREQADSWLDAQKDITTIAEEGWLPLSPDQVTSEKGGAFDVLNDLSILSIGLDAPQDVHTITFTTDLDTITGLRFDATAHASFKYGLSRHRNVTRLNEVEVFVQTADMLEAKQAQIKTGAFSFSKERGAIKSTFDGDLVTDWVRTTGTEDNRFDPIAWAYEFDEPITGGADTQITVRLHYLGIAGNDRSAFGRIAVSATSDLRPDIEAPLGIPERAVAALTGKRHLTAKDHKQMASFYTTVDESRDAKRQEIAELHAQKRRLEAKFPYTLYTQALPKPREVRYLPRGNWLDDSGPVVEPGIPEFLPQLQSEGERPTRLDLAQWLVDPENPLTSRVFVNKLWKLYFGKGISGVLDDLGSQGEPPIHPKLLDWLAVEFIDSGWDVKHMVRVIVESSTYQQTSDATPALMERDPKNRLLARQSVFRYEAEMVRDAALSVSGLLNASIGGPSVHPYQPEGYWEHLNFPKREYEADQDDSQYRRGLYIHWQRSFLHPSMKAFDAPSREECVAERTLSNTPLQALALLNDPSYVEAARHFAERIASEGGDSIEAKVRWAMRQGVLRIPTDEETAILKDIYTKHRAENTATDELEADLAAWTSVARVVLNLHETITRS